MKSWKKVIQGTVVCFVAVMCRPAVMAAPMAVDSLLPAPGVSFQRVKNISEQEAVLLARCATIRWCLMLSWVEWWISFHWLLRKMLLYHNLQ